MRGRWLLVVCLAGCPSTRAPSPISVPLERLTTLASQAPDEPMTWTLSEALRRAVVHAPELDVAEGRVSAAVGGVLDARAVKNPEVRIQADRIDPAAPDPRMEVNLRLPVPNPGTVLARSDEAKARLAEERADRRVLIADVVHDVTVLFHRVRLGRALIEAHAARVRAAEAREAATLARVAEGKEDALDEMEARERVAETRADLREHASRVDDWTRRLARLLGVSHPAIGELTSAPSEANLTQDPEVLVATALASRPELAVALAELDQARAKRREAAWQGVPWFDFVQVGVDSRAGALDSLDLTLSVGVPLFSFGVGARREAAGETQRREAELDAVVLAVADEVYTAVSNARLAWRAHEESAARLAEVREQRPEDLGARQDARWAWREAALAIEALEAELEWHEARASLVRSIGRDGADEPTGADR